MATSTALSKMRPCPSAWALCCAPLKTFSNTRGTATTIVGRTSASSSWRCAMSVANASLMPHSTPTRAMIFGQRVRERQEHEADLFGFEHRPHRVEVLQHVRAQVAVRDRTTLGPSRRARRVDDRGEPIRRERGDALGPARRRRRARPGEPARRDRRRRSRTTCGTRARRRRWPRASRPSPASRRRRRPPRCR